MDKNKILIELSIPLIEKNYDLFIPINKKVGTVKKLIEEGLLELTDHNYIIKQDSNFYSKETEALIKKKAKCLEGEDDILYSRRLKGDTYKEMAENMHSPLPSLISHTHKAIGKLYNLTVAELRRQGKLYSSPFRP